MPFVINTETGKRELVTDADAANKLSSGEYFVEEGERLNVIDDQGNFSNIPAIDYLRLQMSQGYRPATEEYTDDLRKVIAKEKKYDTLGQEILTGVEGGLRGATFGLSDAALTGLGISDKQAMKDRQEVNSTVAGVTEVGGMIGGALLTGGVGAEIKAGVSVGKAALGAGKAASTARKILALNPAGQAAKLGTSILAKGVGKGVVGKVAAGVVAGAVEGALYGSGQGVSELALSNKPLSAERIVSTIGSSALSGAAYGGVIGGALPVLGAVGSAVGGAAKKQITKLPEKIQKLLPSSIKETEAKLMGYRNTLTKEIDQADTLLQQTRSDIVSEIGVLTSPERIASEGALGTGATKTLRNAVKEFDKAENSYRVLFTDAETIGFKSANVVDGLLQLEGKELRKGISAVGKYHEKGNNLRKALDNFRTGKDDLGVDILLSAGMKPKVSGVTNTLRKLTGAKEAIKESKRLGLAEIVGVLEVSGLDENIPGLGWIPDPILKAIVYGKLMHKHGMGYFNKKMYERVAKGVSAADAATMSVASKAAIGADKVDSGIRAFLKGNTVSAAKRVKVPATLSILNSTTYNSEVKHKKGKTAQEAYKIRREELDTLSASPEVVKAKVAKSLGPVEESVIAAVQQVQIRKVNFLAGKLPRDPSGERIIPKEYKPSNIDLKKYSRYMRAAENPATVLEDMKNGRLTQEAIEALKVVYPEMYVDIQTKIIEAIPELKLTLKYKDKLQLSRLFQVAVDPSMEPAFINAMQEEYQLTNGKTSKPGKSFSVPAMDGPVTDTLTSNKPGNF